MNSRILSVASRKHTKGIPFSEYNISQLKNEAAIKAVLTLLEEGRLNIEVSNTKNGGHDEVSVTIREYFNAAN